MDTTEALQDHPWAPLPDKQEGFLLGLLLVYQGFSAFVEKFSLTNTNNLRGQLQPIWKHHQKI